MSAKYKGRADIEIFGYEGSLFLSHQLHDIHQAQHEKVYGSRLEGDNKREVLQIPSKFRPFEDQRDGRSMPFRLLVREFVAGVKAAISPSPNFYDGWKTQQVLDGVLESSRTGKRITIR